MANLIVVLSKCNKSNTAFQRSTLARVAPDIQKDDIFYMNNSAFVVKPKNGRIVKTSQLEEEWKRSMKTARKIADLVESMDYVPVKDLERVMRQRLKLREFLHLVKLEVSKYQDISENLEVVECNRREIAMNQEKFKNYIVTESFLEKTYISTPYYNTICSNCDHVCHKSCNLSEVSHKGSNHFLYCWAMNATDNCIRCPKKCSHNDHYHAKHIIVEELRTVEKVLEDMKEQYDEAVWQGAHASLEINDLTATRRAVDATIQAIVADLKNTCEKLKKLCSGFNFAGEVRLMRQQVEQHLKHKVRTMAGQNSGEFAMKTFERVLEGFSGADADADAAVLRRKDLDEDDPSSSEDNEEPAAQTVSRWAPAPPEPSPHAARRAAAATAIR